LTLGEPIHDNRLNLFEDKYGIKLTTEFKFMLQRHNGFSLSGTEVNGLGNELRAQSLDRLYEQVQSNYQKFMPKEIIPFSADGAGNYYCLDLTRSVNEICPIIFYQHDYEYNDINDIETCNSNFAEWIDEVMITWTLEQYDYNGASKTGILYKLKKLFK
jgi:cell wall assembly regulator SMI1